MKPKQHAANHSPSSGRSENSATSAGKAKEGGDRPPPSHPNPCNVTAGIQGRDNPAPNLDTGIDLVQPRQAARFREGSGSEWKGGTKPTDRSEGTELRDEVVTLVADVQ